MAERYTIPDATPRIMPTSCRGVSLPLCSFKRKQYHTGTSFALQPAKSSLGSDDHVKWRSRLQRETSKNSVPKYLDTQIKCFFFQTIHSGYNRANLSHRRCSRLVYHPLFGNWARADRNSEKGGNRAHLDAAIVSNYIRVVLKSNNERHDTKFLCLAMLFLITASLGNVCSMEIIFLNRLQL